MTSEIILGPPGTGKTTTLLNMVSDELSSGTAPDRIGYVSFTKQAANEAVERACEKFSLSKSDFRFFRTLHSMCFQSLGLSNSDVFEGKKMMEFGDWMKIKLSEHIRMDDTTMFGFTEGDRALFMENLARVMCVPLRQLFDHDSDGLSWHFVDRVSRGLAQYKKDTQLVDYTDMLVLFAESEWTPPIEVLFVDEAQDLSMLQWRVVQKLARRCRRVVIAGDDDQAIYRWAGAAVDHFVDMEGNVRVLDHSWRVPPEVQSLSHEIISRVRHRRPKEWSPRDASGQLSRVSSFDDVDLWGEDVLILGRNAFTLRNIEPVLKSEGIIYSFRGHSSVRQSTLEAVKTWEALRSGTTVTADDARRVYDLMSSGKGVRRGFKQLPGLSPDHPVDLSYLQEHGGLMRREIWHEALDRIPQPEMLYMLRARQKGERLSGKPRVRLSTIHGSKGGEAEHVVVLRDMARRTYDEMRYVPEDEARVWYVAVTRTKERLTVVEPSTRLFYDL